MEQSLIRKSRKAVNASSILVTRWLANFRNLHVVQAVSTNSENIRRHRLTVRTLLLQSRKRSSTLRVARDAQYLPPRGASWVILKGIELLTLRVFNLNIKWLVSGH